VGSSPVASSGHDDRWIVVRIENEEFRRVARAVKGSRL
jgi:hypothetical protein